MEVSLCGFGPHVFFQGSMFVNGRTVWWGRANCTTETKQESRRDVYFPMLLLLLHWCWECRFSSWVCFHIVALSWAHADAQKAFIIILFDIYSSISNLIQKPNCLSSGLLLTTASKIPSAVSSSDFLSFSDSSLRPGGATTFSSPPSFSSCLPKPSTEGNASEGTAPLFGSLMSSATASAGVYDS